MVCFYCTKPKPLQAQMVQVHVNKQTGDSIIYKEGEDAAVETEQVPSSEFILKGLDISTSEEQVSYNSGFFLFLHFLIVNCRYNVIFLPWHQSNLYE